MALTTVQISGYVTMPDGTSASNTYITFTLNENDVDLVDDVVVHRSSKSVLTSSTGYLELDLWPNSRGQKGTSYKVTAAWKPHNQSAQTTTLGYISLTEGGVTDLSDLLVEVEAPLNAYVVSYLTEAEYESIVAQYTADAQAAQEAAEQARDRSEAALAEVLAVYDEVTEGLSTAGLGGLTQATADQMLSEQGFVLVKGATTVSENVNIYGPTFFETGGYITVDSGYTVTFYGPVDSVRQHIFRGLGNVAFGHDNSKDRSGEDSRMAHISWFGVFPTGDSSDDMGPLINRASLAMGNAREAVLEFDIGNYQVNSEIQVTRGTLIAGVDGAGDRRTLFKTNSDGFSLFRTIGDAVAFRGIQFEHHSTLSDRTSPWIEVAHKGVNIDYVNVTSTSAGILIQHGALGTRIKNLHASYGVNRGAGSYLIKDLAGSTVIETVFLPSSGYGPEALILLSADDGTISDISIDDVRWQSPSIGVKIEASAGSVSGVTATDLRQRAYSSTICPAVVKVDVSGSYGVTELVVTSINTTANTTYALDFDHASTGYSRNIVVDQIVMGGSGAVINLTKTAGFVQRLRVGQSATSRTLITSSGVDEAEIFVAAETFGDSNGRYVSVASATGDAGIDLESASYGTRIYVDESAGDFVLAMSNDSANWYKKMEYQTSGDYLGWNFLEHAFFQEGATVRASAGFVDFNVIAEEAGKDPRITLETSTANWRMRVDSSSGDDFIVEKSADGTTWTELLKFENGTAQNGLHVATPAVYQNGVLDYKTRVEIGVGATADVTLPKYGGLLWIMSDTDGGYPQIQLSGQVLIDLGPSRNLKQVFAGGNFFTTTDEMSVATENASAITVGIGHATDGVLQIKNTSSQSRNVTVWFVG